MTTPSPLARVALAHGLTVADLTGPSQVRRIALVRHEAIRAVHALGGRSYADIGAMFNRNAASIAYALRKPYTTHRRVRAQSWGVEVSL